MTSYKSPFLTNALFCSLPSLTRGCLVSDVLLFILYPWFILQDMVNRRISMDMMMAVAKNQKHKQFIFLTPQNMRWETSTPTRFSYITDYYYLDLMVQLLWNHHHWGSMFVNFVCYTYPRIYLPTKYNKVINHLTL